MILLNLGLDSWTKHTINMAHPDIR
jgi:hypothetical protein